MLKKVFMFDFLEHIQNKPRNSRRKIAWGSSVLISVLIFAIWTSATFYGKRPADSVALKKDGASPLQNLRANVLSGLENLQNQFNDLKSEVGSISKDYYEAQVASSTASSSYEIYEGTSTSP